MNREQRYWEEYAAAKAAALKMAAKLTAREKGYVVTATRRALTDDVRRDQSRQRRFERSFLSLEFPKDDGLPYDYSFGSREVNRLVRKLDEPFTAHRRNLRFRQALYRLRHRPKLQQTLRAIREHRHRKAILLALGIPDFVYDLRLSEIRKALGV